MFFGKFAFDTKYVIIFALVISLLLPQLAVYLENFLIPVLIVLITISLKDLKFDNLNKKDYEEIFSLFLLNYGVITGFYFLMTYLFVPSAYQNALYVYAIMPVAVGSIAFTKLYKGNLQISFITVLVSYIAALFLIPFLGILIFGEQIGVSRIVTILLAIIIVPFLISRLLHYLEFKFDKKPDTLYRIIFNICLALMFYIIIGVNRDVLFFDLGVVAYLFSILIIMKVGVILLVYFLFKNFVTRRNLVVILLFSSLKNVSGAVAITILLFGVEATLPFAVHALTFPPYILVLNWLLKQ